MKFTRVGYCVVGELLWIPLYGSKHVGGCSRKLVGITEQKTALCHLARKFVTLTITKSNLGGEGALKAAKQAKLERQTKLAP